MENWHKIGLDLGKILFITFFRNGSIPFKIMISHLWLWKIR